MSLITSEPSSLVSYKVHGISVIIWTTLHKTKWVLTHTDNTLSGLSLN